MRSFLVKTPLIVMVGAGLLLGGCATRESVDNVRGIAESAKADAASAMAAAQKAQSTADADATAAQAASTSAQAAAADAQKANDRLDKVEMTMKRWAQHHHRHHHHHHHHHAMTKPDTTQPGMQK